MAAARKLSPRDEAEIGAALVVARAAGVPWSVLERDFRSDGLSRTTLWRLWRAEARSQSCFETSTLLDGRARRRAASPAMQPSPES